MYSDDFGPGVFDVSGKIWGVLSNAITVYFERGTSPDRVADILTAMKATKFIQVRENQYNVEFPKSWGYEVIDVAKQIIKFEEVCSVENQLRVIDVRF